MSHLLPRLLPVQNVRIFQQESLPYLRRRAGPRWKGVGGGANGVVGRGAGDVGKVLVGGGIVEVDGVEGGGGDEAAVDKVFDCGDRRVGGGAMQPGGGLGGGLLEEGFGNVEDRRCHDFQFLLPSKGSLAQDDFRTPLRVVFLGEIQTGYFIAKHFLAANRVQ